MNKKILIVLLMLTFTLSSVVNADGTTVNDIDKSSGYARNAIQYLAEQKIINGDQNGNFNPQKSVTRAEMIALMAKAMNLDTSKVPEKATFKDVPKDSWMFKYIEAAYSQGIVSGISTTEFKPNDKITREQMAIIFVNALKLIKRDSIIEFNNINSYSDNAKISSWAQKEVEVAIEAGLMSGMPDKTFAPKAAANKEQAAVVIENLLKNKDSISKRFNVPTMDENTVKLFINDESILLKSNVRIIDGKVFIPMELLNKYIMDVNVNDIDENAQIIELIPAEDFANTEIQNFWFSVGQSKAYKNVQSNPFAGTADNQKNEIILKAIPVQIEDKTYIAAEDVLTVLGLEYSYVESENKVVINHPYAGKNSNLYFALKKLAYFSYLGETNAQGFVKVTNNSNNQLASKTTMSYSRQADNYTLQMYTKDVYQQVGLDPKTLEQDVIIIGDKMYEKDLKDNKWTVSNYENEGVFYTDNLYDPLFENNYVDNVTINQILFDNFAKLEVTKAGYVNISGIPAIKYSIKLDQDSIKNTMTPEEYQEVKAFLDAEYKSGISYTYEFYVANNTVIKQAYDFTGNSIDENGAPIKYASHVDIYYKNIGKKLPVTAPPASQIKQQ